MYFKMVPLHLLWEAQGDFSLIFTVRTWSTSGRWNSQKCGGPDDSVPLEFLSLTFILRIVSSNLSVTVQVSLPWHWFLWRFILLGLCSDKFYSLYFLVGVSNSGDSGASLTPPLSNLRGVVDFSVYQAFYVLGLVTLSFLYATLETRSSTIVFWMPYLLKRIVRLWSWNHFNSSGVETNAARDP